MCGVRQIIRRKTLVSIRRTHKSNGVVMSDSIGDLPPRVRKFDSRSLRIVSCGGAERMTGRRLSAAAFVAAPTSADEREGKTNAEGEQKALEGVTTPLWHGARR